METPYIGASISLISKSEIRYEGILFTIDTKDSNIALQNGALPAHRHACHAVPQFAQRCKLCARRSTTPGVLVHGAEAPAPRRSALLWHRGPQEQWAADPAQQRGVRLHHLPRRRHQGPARHGPGAKGPRHPAPLARSACAAARILAHCARARWSPAGGCPRERERARNPNWRAVQAPQSSAQQLDPAIVNVPSISTV